MTVEIWIPIRIEVMRIRNPEVKNTVKSARGFVYSLHFSFYNFNHADTGDQFVAGVNDNAD
jgi:hypothetical protein